ncbi:MAG: hypothetical protein ACYDB2_05845 [Acidimicrobiales bacterium]
MSNFALRLVTVAALTFAFGVLATTVSGGLVALPAFTSAPIPVQSGYDASELFCGAIGEVKYVAAKEHVELRLILTPIRANRQYVVDWRNNKVRGYTIGVFSTNRSGTVRRGSVRMFRPGEVRGIGVDIYYLVGNTPSGLIRLTPCGPK